MAKKSGIETLITALFYTNVWELSIEAMLLLCLALICCTTAIGFGFWLAIFLRSKHQYYNRPEFGVNKYLQLHLLTWWPHVYGVTLAFLAMGTPIGLLYLFLGGNKPETTYLGCFNNISGNFLHESSSRLIVRSGRYGLAFCILGGIILHQCIQLLSPRRGSTSEEARERISIQNKLNAGSPLHSIRSTYEFNLGYYRFAAAIVIIYCLFVIFFSFSKEYSSSRQLFYLGSISLIGEYLKRKIDVAMGTNKLIAVPFLIVIEVMNLFVARLSSSTFSQVDRACLPFFKLYYSLLLTYLFHFTFSFSKISYGSYFFVSWANYTCHR
jgi:hypothetical protein